MKKSKPASFVFYFVTIIKTAMNLIFQISLIFLSITFLGIILRYLKQPLTLAYILAGIVLGPSVLNIVVNEDLTKLGLQVAVCVVLFVLGLKLNLKVLSFLGNNLLVSYLVQFLLFFSVIFMFCISVELSIFESIILSFALSFSSNILTIKLLDEKKDIDNLYGKLAVGFSIFQVFLFVFSYLIFSTYSPALGNEVFLRKSLELVFKLVIVLGNIYLISNFIIPKFSKFLEASTEFLILFGISWVLVVAGGLKYIGVPYEIGALIAGMFLASQSFASVIYERLKAVRDFSILIILTILGLQINLQVITTKVFLIVLFMLFIFVLKNIITTFMLRVLSYSRRVSLLGSVSLTHVGELSLVLLSLPLINFDKDFYSVFNFIFILSVVFSSYILHYSDKYLNYFEKYAGFFLKDSKSSLKEDPEVILFGCGVDGHDFIEEFKDKKTEFIGVDFNPEVVTKLKNKKFNIIFGDAEDRDLFEKLKIKNSKMVVSTIGDFETNKFILEELKLIHYRGIKIIYSYNSEEAINLYRLGATVVVLPQFLSSATADKNTSKFGFSLDSYESEKATSLEMLNKKLILGYTHSNHKA